MPGKNLFLIHFVVLCSLLQLVLTEVVSFRQCPDLESDDGTVISRNCTVNEVRVTPCKEASENKACRLKKGTSAAIVFDFVPGATTSSLTSRAYWASASQDLPFVGMDTDACHFTTCPVTAGEQSTYDFNLQISKKFPTRQLNVKWKLWDEGSMECCFIVAIALTK